MRHSLFASDIVEWNGLEGSGYGVTHGNNLAFAWRVYET
jgi:hypothetical protein